ncbi:MAG: hypothetical protein U0P30_16215 [Vicinamibacterales bacterium]
MDAHYGVVATSGIESSMFVACVVTACALVLDGRLRMRRAGGAVPRCWWRCGPRASRWRARWPPTIQGAARAFARARRPWVVAAPLVAGIVAVWGSRLIYFGALPEHRRRQGVPPPRTGDVRPPGSCGRRVSGARRARCSPRAWAAALLTAARIAVVIVAAGLGLVAFSVDM